MRVHVLFPTLSRESSNQLNGRNQCQHCHSCLCYGLISHVSWAFFPRVSLAGSSWRARTCRARDTSTPYLPCPLAGRSGRTTSGEPTMSTMRAEPHGGTGPPHSKTSLLVLPQNVNLTLLCSTLLYSAFNITSLCVCVCVCLKIQDSRSLTVFKSLQSQLKGKNPKNIHTIYILYSKSSSMELKG